MTLSCHGCLNGTAHTPECAFQHFLCYTGYGRLSDPEIQRLRTAYFHGSDSKRNQPRFTKEILWLMKRR